MWTTGTTSVGRIRILPGSTAIGRAHTRADSTSTALTPRRWWWTEAASLWGVIRNWHGKPSTVRCRFRRFRFAYLRFLLARETHCRRMWKLDLWAQTQRL